MPCSKTKSFFAFARRIRRSTHASNFNLELIWLFPLLSLSSSSSSLCSLSLFLLLRTYLPTAVCARIRNALHHLRCFSECKYVLWRWTAYTHTQQTCDRIHIGAEYKQTHTCNCKTRTTRTTRMTTKAANDDNERRKRRRRRWLLTHVHFRMLISIADRTANTHTPYFAALQWHLNQQK